MRRDIYVYSTLENGAATQSFFKKSFQVKESSLLPEKGTDVYPGCLADNYGQLEKGVVTDVRTTDSIQILGVAIPTSTEDLRAIFIPNGYQEVSGFLE